MRARDRLARSWLRATSFTLWTLVLQAPGTTLLVLATAWAINRFKRITKR